MYWKNQMCSVLVKEFLHMALKKIISLAVLLAAALAAVGCADSTEGTEAPGSDIAVTQGSVEEDGQMGDVEVTGGASGIEPTAELDTPDTLGGDETTPPVDVTVPASDENAEEPVTSYATLAADLQERGVTVEELGELDNAPIGVAAQTLSVNGEEVTLYQFESADAAQAEAEAIVMGGSEAEAELMLTPGTYVFQEGDVVVTYDGSDSTIYGALAAVLGPELN